MKKTLSLIMILAVVFGLLAGCSKDTTTPTATPTPTAQSTPETSGGEVPTGPVLSDETLTIAINAEPATLMFGKGMANVPTEIAWCMYDPLFVWKDDGSVVPYLAESFEWIDDTHFRIKLREDVYFQNGDKLTAEDLLASNLLQRDLAATGTNIFNYDEFRVEDEYTLVYATKGVWVQAPERLAQSANTYSKKAIEHHNGADNSSLVPLMPLGTGKYQFKEWVQGQYIMLERNDNYWNQEALPYYKYIKFVFINDNAARALAVEAGDVDIAANLPTTVAAAYEGHDKVTNHYLDTKQIGVIVWNCNNPENPDSPLKNKKVREAITLLIDKAAFNALSAAGKGKYGETVISPYSIVYDPPAPGWEHKVDVERAKQLLAEAGYPNGFTLDYIAPPQYVAQGEVLQECLRKGGIELNVNQYEAPVFVSLRREGKYDIHFSSYNGLNYTENIRLCDGRISFAEVNGGYGYVGDEKWYEIADKCYSTFDIDERIKVYKEAQDHMKENFICLGTNTVIRLELMKAGLKPPIITAAGASGVDYTVVRPED